MILGRLGARDRPAKLAARRLYSGAVAQARAPALYAVMGIADSPEGRFEALTLHVLLLLERLKLDGPRLDKLWQGVFDIYVRDLDGALREMGVGDLSVGRKMKRLGEAFYGRAKAFEHAFASLPDRGPLREVVGRTLLEERPGADPAPLADYAEECRARLGDQPLDELLGGLAAWRDP